MRTCVLAWLALPPLAQLRRVSPLACGNDIGCRPACVAGYWSDFRFCALWLWSSNVENWKSDFGGLRGLVDFSLFAWLSQTPRAVARIDRQAWHSGRFAVAAVQRRPGQRSFNGLAGCRADGVVVLTVTVPSGRFMAPRGAPDAPNRFFSTLTRAAPKSVPAERWVSRASGHPRIRGRLIDINGKKSSRVV